MRAITRCRRAWLAVAIVTLFAGCGKPLEPEVRPEQVMDFALLYERNCAGCHGIDGRQGAAQQLNDAVYLAIASDARIEQVVSRGVAGTSMLPFGKSSGGTLTDDQIRALVAGMRRHWEQPDRLSGVVLPAYSAEDAVGRGSAPGDSDRGQQAYATHCARCHGPGGRGGSAGSIVDEAFLALTSDQALRTTVITGHAHESTAGWRGYAPGRPMSPQEISDVVAWIGSHRGRHD